MGSIAKKGLDNYLKQLQQNPLRTKVITAGVLSAISDIVSQKLTGIQSIQFKRLLLKVIFGAAYLGPFGHYYHTLLDKIFKGKRDSKTVAKKVLIEQLTSSPWNNFLFMIYYGLVVEGQPWVNVKAKVKKDYPSVHTRNIASTINVPKIQVTKIHKSTPPNRTLVAKLDYQNNYISATTTTLVKEDPYYYSGSIKSNIPNSMEIVKLHLIMEIVADRLEMHKNVGIQRDNWNHLLMTSVNMITLSAATLVGIVANGSSGAPFLAMKVSSTILYIAATGFLIVMNKIQPSQLAEEQRNAARLFKQLHGELRTKLYLGNPSENDVNEAMEKVLALDKAYPLPLLGSMLEKFPQTVEPAVWWPPMKQRYRRTEEGSKGNNGWDSKLEKGMKEIMKVLKKDMGEYFRLSKIVLNLNKILAVSGPVLTGLAAFGSACLGSVNAPWPVMLGVIGGTLASVVNTLEHGGQVGMVFELYRAALGFFKLMEESIEQNIIEKDPDRSENGELFEIKVALQLGRSVSELRQFAAAVSSSDDENASEEFASKLF
ncbi:unnamed protein product [Lupinus luteus]|uniref:F-box protein n=1 Tax=Lupinus luteus TaxID=3873 RepID=A0AAV1VWK6_LUPLU